MKNITLQSSGQKSWMLLLQTHGCLSVIVTVLTANLVQLFVSFSPQLWLRLTGVVSSPRRVGIAKLKQTQSSNSLSVKAAEFGGTNDVPPNSHLRVRGQRGNMIPNTKHSESSHLRRQLADVFSDRTSDTRAYTPCSTRR